MRVDTFNRPLHHNVTTTWKTFKSSDAFFSFHLSHFVFIDILNSCGQTFLLLAEIQV